MPFKGRSFDLNEATMKYLDPSMKKGVCLVSSLGLCRPVKSTKPGLNQVLKNHRRRLLMHQHQTLTTSHSYQNEVPTARLVA